MSTENNERYRIQKRGENRYEWVCPIDRGYFFRGLRLSIIALGSIGGFVLLYGGLLSLMFQDLEGFLIVLGCLGVFALISVGACWLCYGRVPNPTERYTLTNDYVQTGTGKSSVYFTLSRARVVTVTRRYIGLKGRTAYVRVYATEEDMPFVRGFITSRVPGEAEVRYE